MTLELSNLLSDQDLVSKQTHKMETEIHQRCRTSGSTVLQQHGDIGTETDVPRRQTLDLQLSKSDANGTITCQPMVETD